MRNSIKFRLTLFNTSIVLIVFLVFGLFVYYGTHYILSTTLNKQLLLMADAIEDSYIPEKNRFGYLEPGTESFHAAQNAWVRIIRKDGSVYFASIPFQKNPIPFPIKKARQLTGKTHLYRNFQAASQQSYRSVILPIYNPAVKQDIGWIEVARSTEHLHTMLTSLKKLLIFAAPVLLFLVGGISYWMVQHAFRPLMLMRKQIDSISHQQLEQRLPVVNPKDELGQLALRFNDLLSRLEQSFKKQQQLLSDVSHELKTPIAVLRTRLEQELNNPDLPAPVQARIASDIEELVRMSQLVSDLSLLAHSMEGVFQEQKQPVNLKLFLVSLEEDVKTLALMKHHHLNWQVCSDVLVEGNPEHLRRIFYNVLENAIKYTPEGGHISLQCRTENKRVVVEITDTGIGISEKDVPKVFERFYRSDQARQMDATGRGLGLSITKWLLEIHNGTIDIASSSPSGTTVRITLPKYQPM